MSKTDTVARFSLIFARKDHLSENSAVRLSRDSKIGPVRVNHKGSTTGDGTRNRATLKSLTSLSLSGMVLSLMFPVCVSSRVAAVHLGGGITVCAMLMTSYRPMPMSRATNTRTSMGSSRRLYLPSLVCPVRSTLTFFGFSGFLLTNSCGRTMRAWARRIRSEIRLGEGQGIQL